jgi:hypothetical protein
MGGLHSTFIPSISQHKSRVYSKFNRLYFEFNWMYSDIPSFTLSVFGVSSSLRVHVEWKGKEVPYLTWLILDNTIKVSNEGQPPAAQPGCRNLGDCPANSTATDCHMLVIELRAYFKGYIFQGRMAYGHLTTYVDTPCRANKMLKTECLLPKFWMTKIWKGQIRPPEAFTRIGPEPLAFNIWHQFFTFDVLLFTFNVKFSTFNLRHSTFQIPDNNILAFNISDIQHFCYQHSVINIFAAPLSSTGTFRVTLYNVKITITNW